ncbi:MAG: hypothetical protein QOF06_2160 [Solirubrobacterales bacterium]|jgi:hypothetical protein|nr:hypothetical protein [Solirubrobacterales bacterium]
MPRRLSIAIATCAGSGLYVPDSTRDLISWGCMAFAVIIGVDTQILSSWYSHMRPN